MRLPQVKPAPNVASSTRSPRRKRFPFEILHYQEVGVVLPPDIMKHTDVGMVQRRDDLRLALETLPHLRVFRPIPGDQLDGDNTFQPGVGRSINLSHTPHANRPKNPVGTQPEPCYESHLGICHFSAFPSAEVQF